MDRSPGFTRRRIVLLATAAAILSNACTSYTWVDRGAPRASMSRDGPIAHAVVTDKSGVEHQVEDLIISEEEISAFRSGGRGHVSMPLSQVESIQVRRENAAANLGAVSVLVGGFLVFGLLSGLPH